MTGQRDTSVRNSDDARLTLAIDLLGSVVIVVVGVTASAAIVRVERRLYALAGGVATPIEVEPELASPACGAFALTEFGGAMRLSWPGGGLALRRDARVAYWADRYAAVVDFKQITIVDAQTARQVRIEMPPAVWLSGNGLGVYGRTLVIACGTGVYEVSLDELEAAAEGDHRSHAIELVVRYPLRRLEAREPGRIAWVADNYVLVNVGQKQLRVQPWPGATRGEDVVMRDELVPWTFAAIETAQGETYPVSPPEATRRFEAKLVRGKRRDPAETGAAVAPTERLDELERLMGEVARASGSSADDDAPRLVLADLLQDLGEAFGAWLAREGGGPIAPAKRRKALGPLAHFFDEVVFRGGLPWSARLVKKPPLDEEYVAPALADLRLGMLATLRRGKGPLDLYVRFVASPRAIGLRTVDVPERAIATALIAAKRDQLVRLSNVRFSDRGPLRLLADPTFDRVTTIDTVVQHIHVPNLMTRVETDEYGVFARAPRHLVLHERDGNHLALVASALSRFAGLPLSALTTDGVTLARDNSRVVARIAYRDPLVYDAVATALRAVADLERIELAVEDTFLLGRMRALLPRVEVVSTPPTP